MEEQTEGIQYIPKDALIPIQVGAGFLQRLQKALIFLAADRTEEQIELLQEKIQKGLVEEGSWMYHFETIQTLVSNIEQTAVEKKLTVTKPQ